MSAKPYYHHDFFGNKMFSNPGDLGVDIGWCNGKPLASFAGKGEIGYMLDNLREGQTALDLGANIGYFTVLFSRQVGPPGHVLAFEPGPLSFALLQTNIRINGLTQAQAFNTAVGDRSGTIDLFICRTGESDNRVEGMVTDPQDRDRIEVPLISVDDFLAARPAQRIDYVKIDIQGAEWDALKGMRRTIADNPEIQIVLEYAPVFIELVGGTPREFFDFIRSLGLRIFDLPEEGVATEVSNDWLLGNIGRPPMPRAQTNLVLRR